MARAYHAFGVGVRVGAPRYEVLAGEGSASTPEAGILSRTLANDGGVNVTHFAFADGESLSEHTSTRGALLQVVSGRARMEVDGDTLTLGAGAVMRLDASVPHSVTAEGPLVLLLTLLPRPQE